MDDPRNKLETAHMILVRLAKGQDMDQFSLKIAKKEIDVFIEFFKRRENKFSFIPEIIDLLIPSQKIIELHLNNENSMRAMIEVALWDFDKAMVIIGKILNGENNPFAA